MKEKNKFNIIDFKYLILIVSIFFMFNINVFAESEYAYCYYNFSPPEGLYERYYYVHPDNNKDETIIVQIAYDSEKYPNINTYARIVKTDKTDFSDGYSYELSKDIKYENMGCGATYNYCMSIEDIGNRNTISDRNGNLMCPSLYFSTKRTGQYNFDYQYKISFSPDSFDPYITINPDKNYSKIHSFSSKDSDKKVLRTCNYKYNMYFTFQNNVGNVGFSIYEDGSVGGITADYNLNSISRGGYEFDGKINDTSKCPPYLKVTNGALSNVTKLRVATNKEDANAEYTGDINNAEDNAFSVIYKSINNSSAKILLRKSGSTLISTFNDKNITIKNLNEYLSNFQNSDKTKYPKYIFYDTKTKSYEFSKKRATGSNVENYVIQGVGLPDISGNNFKATCESIYGKTFMTFLNDNVFKVIYIAVPILLIVLTSIDFGKIVFTGDKDGIKKAASKFAKRLIASVLIYLTPTLFSTIAGLIGVDEIKECSDYLRKCVQTGDQESCKKYESIEEKNKK